MRFDFVKDNSYLILVNKERHLDELYVPKDLVYPMVSCDVMDEKKFLRKRAANRLEEMFIYALKDNVELVAISGFRSYIRQKMIYDLSVTKRGADYTEQYIAKPGESEHQTGLAMDISTKEINYELEEYFECTSSGIWIQKNSWRFGYILRYPKGKSDITGYQYEPWHIRYVGKKEAEMIYKNDLTLEEFVVKYGGNGENEESIISGN